MKNLALMEFLEAALKDTLEHNPKKVVVAYLDDENDVTFSYHKCNYSDLQRIGQELINEGLIRLVAMSEDKIQEIKWEKEQAGEEEKNDGDY